jgi:hypothetical protein
MCVNVLAPQPQAAPRGALPETPYKAGTQNTKKKLCHVKRMSDAAVGRNPMNGSTPVAARDSVEAGSRTHSLLILK